MDLPVTKLLYGPAGLNVLFMLHTFLVILLLYTVVFAVTHVISVSTANVMSSSCCVFPAVFLPVHIYNQPFSHKWWEFILSEGLG